MRDSWLRVPGSHATPGMCSTTHTPCSRSRQARPLLHSAGAAHALMSPAAWGPVPSLPSQQLPPPAAWLQPPGTPSLHHRHGASQAATYAAGWFSPAGRICTTRTKPGGMAPPRSLARCCLASSTACRSCKGQEGVCGGGQQGINKDGGGAKQVCGVGSPEEGNEPGRGAGVHTSRRPWLHRGGGQRETRRRALVNGL